VRRAEPALVAALVLAVSAGGCGRFRVAPPREATNDPTRLVAQADELARDHDARAARTIYRRVIRENPGTPAAENALYGLGLLYVDPDGRLRDYIAAQNAFGRLLAQYPESVHAFEARAWLAALGEITRAQGDARRLQTDLDRLKELDIEQEGQP
jgi:TolA-binding protein